MWCQHSCSIWHSRLPLARAQAALGLAAAQREAAVGCVCDSQIRDAVQIIEMGFPVYNGVA